MRDTIGRRIKSSQACFQELKEIAQHVDVMHEQEVTEVNSQLAQTVDVALRNQLPTVCDAFLRKKI